MTTDKELLELAAKAAGIDSDWSGAYFSDSGLVWNPLKDDGDALRLAVKLAMDLKTDTAVGECIDGIYANGALASAYIDFKWHEGEEANGNDPCAATRRAIVRAAAEIGKERL